MDTEPFTLKFSTCPIPINLVPHPRLTKLISEELQSKRRLAMISVPSGFEKTTLVVAWLMEIDHTKAWLSLDEADNDLPHFPTYLTATFQLLGEQIGALPLSALQCTQLPVIKKENSDASHS